MRVLVSIAVVVTALTFVSASPAAAGGLSSGQATLTIRTVPALPGVRFAFDGKTYVTGPQGKVQIETIDGTHLLRLLDGHVNSPGVRSAFSRWSDSQYKATRPITIRRDTRVDAGFQQTDRVSFAFADLAGRPVVGRVSRLTLSNTLGSRTSFAPSWPQWLRATGLARRFSGLEQTNVQYSIQQALVGGSNVVNKSQQRFYPALTRRFTATLLLYSARVTVRDFLFGGSSGSGVDLVYPGGATVAYPLHGRPLVLPSLPRGTYEVDVHAGGYVPKVSLALSRNQVLDVKVVSYLDMFVLFLIVLTAVSVLILARRPFLRMRLRSIGSGLRPEPEDLEPPKPLSGARKMLIRRYMPPPETGAAGEAAAPSAPRRPLPAPGPTAVASNRKSLERPLRELPLRSLETAVASVRRRRESLPNVPGRQPRLPPAQALTGERLELINVYMRDQLAPALDLEPPAPETPKPETVPEAEAEGGDDTTATTAAPDTVAPTPVPMLAPVIELRPAPAPAVEEEAAQPVEEELAPAVEEPAPAVEESPAPPPKRAVPARRKRAAPAAEKSATATPKSTTPARRKRATTAKPKTTAQSTRTRANAKKSTTAAKPKSTTAKRSTTARKATTAKSATPAKKPTARRTPATVDAPQEDLEKLRAADETEGGAGDEAS